MPALTRLVGISVLMAYGIGLSACKDPSTKAPVVASVSISGLSGALVPGATMQLSASATTATGTPVSNAAVTWSSSDAAVATVSASGLVTAVAAGNAIMTARSGLISGTAAITVNAGGVVATTGGTITAAAGAVTLSIPSGALPASTPVTVTPKPDTGRSEHVVGTPYKFDPSGLQFAQPVDMALKYDPTKLPPNTDKASLRIARLTNGRWIPLTEGVVVDSATNTVRAKTRSFSPYGVVRNPCLPQDGTATTIADSITQQDCLYAVAGRRSDYFRLVPPAGMMLILKSVGPLSGIFGIKQATEDATTGLVFDSDTIGTEMRFVGNGDAMQLFVSGRDSTQVGRYTVTRSIGNGHTCASATVPYIVMAPGASYGDVIRSDNSCTGTVRFGPTPALGKPLLLHYYVVKLEEGKQYTVTARGMAGQSALTIYRGSPVAQHLTVISDGVRSQTFTAAATAYHLIEISSGGFQFADFTGNWLNPSFSYSLTVSRGQAP